MPQKLKKKEFFIILKIHKGFHVQANPAAAPYLIPLTLSLRSKGQIKVTYPKSLPYQLEDGTKLLVYGGTVKLKVKIQKGKPPFSFLLKYQACDKRSCFFPQKVSFSIPAR